MKVAVSATGKNLESSIDERFGRCRYFIIVETDDMSYEVVENANADLSTSAGIQSASFVASTGAEAVITGNCGPKAMQVFSSTSIKVILGQSGMIRNAVENYKKGALSPSAIENVLEKSGVTRTPSITDSRQSGMGMGGGRGMGMGGGRGMGGGGGRGMGGGGGRGMGRRCQSPYGAAGTADAPAVQTTTGNLSKEQELKHLQQQADQLKKQMEDIQSRIKRLD
ncbi:MAG: NifB/NifX family molybdenum-iron cluster-binding protein [Desulfosarcina sp.]|nr:NifB/NifX family molybdenum-iron cluster-binding protein [Desulfosarcina sp.]MBC2744449.1 NifB/NifX family molybdenum-iron cluster-binding protein [Desulfosarcina sp.]MBC2767357.1 DUF5320 family protein [Desulfosarcina sp.]